MTDLRTGMRGEGSAYQPPDPTRASSRQTWTEYARGFTVEWAEACCISILVGALLLAGGVMLAWPLRTLSGTILAVLDRLDAPQRGFGESNATAAGAPLLQSVWDFAAKDYSHMTTSPAFPGVLSITYFFLSCLLYMAIDMLPTSVPVISRLKQYKVQQDKQVEWAHVWKTLCRTLYMTIGLQIPGVVHQLVAQGPWPYYVGPHVPTPYTIRVCPSVCLSVCLSVSLSLSLSLCLSLCLSVSLCVSSACLLRSDIRRSRCA